MDLIDEIAERVLAKLSERTSSGGTYDSKHLPPDVPSRAHFHALVGGVPAAEKRGRVWFAYSGQPERAFRRNLSNRSGPPGRSIGAQRRVDGLVGFRWSRS